MDLTEAQKKWIDAEIRRLALNEFGDPKGSVYAGGTPLFNEMTGATLDRYAYILKRHPDWRTQSK